MGSGRWGRPGVLVSEHSVGSGWGDVPGGRSQSRAWAGNGGERYLRQIMVSEVKRRRVSQDGAEGSADSCLCCVVSGGASLLQSQLHLPDRP